MTVRALIVAVENYAEASGLANVLPGSNDAAKRFCEWLADKKEVFRKGHLNYDPGAFFCCAGPEVEFRTHGTTRPEIVRAVQDLEARGKDDTEELYCFFTGHGFCYPRDELVQDDIFVASDFRAILVSGGACLNLRELIDLLSLAMGPGDHYYFFDACRTEVSRDEVRPIGMGVAFQRSQLGSAGRAVLFSVEQGLPARMDSEFSTHLVNGLNGKGRAKGWYNDDLYVKFEYLWKYVSTKMNRPVSQSIGESEGLILEIKPVPKQLCTIKVPGASADDVFRYTIRRRSVVITQGEMRGPEETVTVPEPGDYQIQLEQLGATLKSLKPPASLPVDLYDAAKDAAEVVFRKEVSGLESVVQSTGTLSVQGVAQSVVRIRMLQGLAKDDIVGAVGEPLTQELEPGDYRVDIEEAGDIVASQIVSVSAGAEIAVDPLSGPLRDAIVKYIGPRDERAIEFSESLGGPTADRDLGLWLALLGASRILGREGDFSKLGRVPLEFPFGAVARGKAAIYILAGLTHEDGPYAVGVGRDPEWTEMAAVNGVPGLFEFFRPTEPGPKIVSFQSKFGPPVSLSTHALPNFATFGVITSGVVPRLRLGQFILPIKGLMDTIPPEVRVRAESTPLKIVRFAVQVERLFIRDHSLVKPFAPKPNLDSAAEPFSREVYDEVTRAKWLDPVVSLIAANDLIRRGALNPKNELNARFGELLPVMVENYRTCFHAIPDVEALAKTVGQPWAVPQATPLLADSVASFSIEQQHTFMPFPNDCRHFGTPWVAWVGAVQPCYPLKS